MKKLPVFQVDSFTDKVFGGNPAAVCIMDSWLDDESMQKIATELNLSETAFFVPTDEKNNLRWFTPKKEVRLCGHATLATAHVIFHHLNPTLSEIEFKTKGGILTTCKKGNGYQIKFPADSPLEIEEQSHLKDLGINFKEVYKGTDDYLFILESEEEVLQSNPDMTAIKNLGSRGAIVSAKGNKFDFVSRCFYPSYGIDEDPVTGSAHTLLAPYWAKKLDKKELSACQLSERKGHLQCMLKDQHVHISGQAKTSIIGEIYLP